MKMHNLSEKEIDLEFDRIVGSSNNYKFPQDKTRYEKGYRYGSGAAFRVLRPQNDEQLCQLLKFCQQHKIAIIPQGGNTGLVGASTPDASGKQVVISTELLNKHIFELDEKNKTITAGAGWVLAALNEKISASNLILPIDISSSGSCNIGGLVATNAAGTRAGRYGNVKHRLISCNVATISCDILSMECIKHPSGNIMQDNSKIDLLNPFVGSQGWLGIITSACFKLTDIAQYNESIIIVPSSLSSISHIFDFLTEKFGKRLTAFEGISDSALRLAAKNIPNARYFFDNENNYDYALLIEVSDNTSQEHIAQELLDAFSHLSDANLVVNGLTGKSHEYWFIRHHLSEALAKEGAVIATDIGIKDRGKLADFRIKATNTLKARYPNLIIAPFGHEMLGALHFNCVWHEKSVPDADKRAIQEIIYDIAVEEFNGTFSAEHGIGPHNQWAYDKYTDEKTKQAAKELKKKYDADYLMNPNFSY